MRDPDRIPEILDAIKTLWEKHPDQRFGQLVLNIVLLNEPELFNMEDTELTALLDHALRSWG